jgi:hypothetical protein
MRTAIALLLSLTFTLSAQAPRRPKLVVAITVDQFRYDYLTKFRDKYNGGLARLLNQGAVFTNAYYEHYPTVTAIGHSTFLTGATPSISGIIANEWFDRETGKAVTSVEDSEAITLGGQGRGGKAASPRRLLVSTVGDELKMAGRGSKVIGISVKDRSAILPAGHLANGAYWFDPANGNFVSSTYYFNELPAWVTDFNKTRFADKFVAAEWKPVGGGGIFKTMAAAADKDYWTSIENSPYANDIVQKFAESAIIGEQLGKRDTTDVLAVSFSANDFIGHAMGPEHPQVRDISIRTDRTLAEFFKFIDTQVGMRNVLVVFTADHGVAPSPEAKQDGKMPGGRIVTKQMSASVEEHLVQKFGKGKWIASGDISIYLNQALIREKKLSPDVVAEEAAAAARAYPHVFRAYTKRQMMNGDVPGDMFDKRVLNGFNQARGADVVILQEPYYLMGGTKGSSHGTPYSYDAHVPVIFLGDWIKPGRYHRRVMVNDIAPTLATILDVETPAGAVGRALDEIIANPVHHAPPVRRPTN